MQRYLCRTAFLILREITESQCLELLITTITNRHTYSGKVLKLSHLYSFYFDLTGIIKGMCKRGEPVAEMKLNFFPTETWVRDSFLLGRTLAFCNLLLLD